jgi:hypothetical protein
MRGFRGRGFGGACERGGGDRCESHLQRYAAVARGAIVFVVSICIFVFIFIIWICICIVSANLG